MADLWDDFEAGTAAKPQASDDLWGDFDRAPVDFSGVQATADSTARPAIPNVSVGAPTPVALGDVVEPEGIAGGDLLGGILGAITNPAAALGQITAPIARGIADTEFADTFQRGAASAVAGVTHTLGDLIDQAVQQSNPVPLWLDAAGVAVPEAVSDPLGARAMAADALGANREIAAEREAAMAEIGDMPGLGDYLTDPTAALQIQGQRLGTMATESAPLFAAALATRSPAAGSALMGGVTGGQTYTDLRGDGIGRLDAAEAGALSALAEAAGEGVSLPRVMGDGGVAQAALAEGLQELGVSLAQTNITGQATGNETPVLQQITDALEAAGVGGLVGGGANAAISAPRLLQREQAAPPAPAPAPLGDPEPAPRTAPQAQDDAIAPEDDADIAELLVRNLLDPAVAAELGIEPESTPAPVLDEARIAAALGDPEPADPDARFRRPAPESAPAAPPALEAPEVRTSQPAQILTPEQSGQASAPQSAPAGAGADLGKLYQRGNGKNNSSAQALQLPDGTWHVRSRKAGRWQDWEARDSFDPSPAFGYRETAMGGGAVNVPGVGRVPVAKADVESRREADYNPLLDMIAGAGGISREDAARMGVDPAELNARRGIRPLYGKNGIPLDSLREMMIEEGYFPDEDPNAPPTIDLNDVWDMVSRALAGEPVGPLNDDRMLELQMQVQADRYGPEETPADRDPDEDLAAWFDEVESEAGEAVSIGDEAELLSIAELAQRAADAGVHDFDLTQSENEPDGAYAARLWQEIYRAEADRGTDRQAEAGGIRVRVQEGEGGQAGFSLQADPSPRPQEVAPPPSAGLFGAPSARDFIDDAQRSRDARRDGKTGTGRTDMLAGDGELFAGARPAQAIVDQPTSEALESVEDQTDSPAFKRWFGDSKVVDADGEPLVVYHGTEDTPFEVFDRAKAGDGPSKFGFWFAEDESFADLFGGNKIATYLKMEKPKRISSGRWDAIRDRHAKDGTWFERWRDELIAQGFDGLMVEGESFTTSRGLVLKDPSVLAVFQPTQIKSATGNSGAFDPADPSILASEEAAELSESDLTPSERAAFNRSPARSAEQSRESGEDAADLLGLREAIDAALGPVAAKVKYLDGIAGLPERLRAGVERRMEQRSGRGRTAALYDPVTKDVYLFTDVVTTPERAVWNAAHEIAGHKGLRALLGDKLDPALRIAMQNPTVAKVADAITKERKLGGDERLLATEEALAELAAAVRTGDYAHIESRYNVPVPEGIRAKVARAVENFLRRLKVLFNGLVGLEPFTDEDVRGLLEAAWQAVDGDAATTVGADSLASMEPDDYRGEHEAPDSSSGSPLWNVALNGSYPDDVYSANGLRYYGTGEASWDSEAYNLIRRMREKPNGFVEVYRAVPKSIKGNKIQRGSWVTPVRSYAEDHGEGALNGDYRIQKMTVRPRDLWTNGDSWVEWGYDPQPHDPASEVAKREGRPYVPERDSILESVEAGNRAEQRRNEAADALEINRGAAGWNYDSGAWEGRKGELSRARASLQDKMLSWRDVQNQIASQVGQAIPDAQNVYRLENLMHGRVKEGLDRIEEAQIVPLMEAMKAAGVKPAALEEYLYARHAKERNAKIAEINPAMPDGGSGMTNAEADAILAGTDKAKLDPLAKRIDAMTRATRRRLLQHGLITQEQHDAMEAQYSAYVPLKGKETAETDFEANSAGPGRGLDTRAQPVKQALGRGAGNRATDIIANVIADSQRSVILAEKARVGRAVMRLVLANPNPALWQVEPVQTERAVDAAGEVYERVVNDWSDPSIVAVRHRGQLYKVQINNKAMAMALNNVGVDQLGVITRYAGAINRYFSAVLTKYNPAFIPVNASRDALFGLVGLASEHGEAAALDAALHYPLAARAAFRQSIRKSGDGQWDTWAKEFANAGGKTGYVAMPSAEDLSRKIGKGGLSSYSPDGLAKAARALGDAVGSINDAVENALRLSAYVTLRKRGKSVDAAAEYAKNLTVNFNRKGMDGSKFNAWFLFYNAAMQGAHRVSKLLRNPKSWAYTGGLVGVQVMAAMAAMGMEDDDGEPLWNKIPDHVKRRNIVLVTPDGGVVTIPMPYGLNVFTYAAGRLTGALLDEEQGKPTNRAGAITGDLLSATVESFSPVPIGEGGLGLLPTVLRIPVNVQTNRNDFGHRIRNEAPYSKFDIPRASMGRPDTLEVFKLIATGMNRIGGGDEYTPPSLSWFDVAPEDVEYLLGELTGGAGRFITDAATWAQKATGDLPMKPQDRPIIKRFVTSIDEQAAQNALFYDRRDTIARSLDRLRDTFQNDGAEAAEKMLAAMPELKGAGFRRRKNASERGPVGSIITSDGRPQIVVKDDDAVFGKYKAAEKAAEFRNESVRDAYTRTPGSLLPSKESRMRDNITENLNTQRQYAQHEFNKAWTRDVVGSAE
ncbi:LPD38 domain-containing protein [Novilysobacter erysipheiresistens]|uniref:LPD38 domain-containing protein n=1 Tax=Novilysobacter erysipheiresistens TaxID=1749332 RepID=A0ABU7YUM0_9GAMM